MERAMSEIDEDTRLKLHGLKALAIDLNKQMNGIRRVVGQLTEAPEDELSGWPADFCYDNDLTVEQLWERTASFRKAKADGIR
jgi:hypothetical protein